MFYFLDSFFGRHKLTIANNFLLYNAEFGEHIDLSEVFSIYKRRSLAERRSQKITEPMMALISLLFLYSIPLNRTF